MTARNPSTCPSRRSSRLRLIILALCLALSGGQVAAQGAPDTVPIVVVDQERLFNDSLFGQRVLDEIDARSEALAAENREIEQTLIAEERALTSRRRSLEPSAFRREAEAFDTRVTKLRAEQDAKLRDVGGLRDAARQEFYGRTGPVLQQILSERGALMLLDRRAVLSVIDRADITDLAISRIDAEIGDGAETAQ